MKPAKWVAALAALAILLPMVPVPPARATGTPFVPTTIPGAVEWLDASDNTTITVANNRISNWHDKSGQGNNIYPLNPSTAPVVNGTGLNSLATVDFNHTSTNSQQDNGTLETTSFNQPSMANTTVFLVYQQAAAPQKYESTLSFGRPGYTDTEGGFGLGNNASGQTSFSTRTLTGIPFGSNITNNVRTRSTPFSSFVVEADEINGKSATAYFNGTQEGTVPASGASYYSSEFALNNHWVPSYLTNYLATNTIPSQYAEVLIYNRALTLAERQTIEGYLAWKWGLNASLPLNHPFYGGAPSGAAPTIACGPGIFQVQDPNGNTLTCTPSGVIAYASPTPSPTSTATASASPTPTATATATGTPTATPSTYLASNYAHPPSNTNQVTRVYDFLNSMGVNMHVESGGAYTSSNMLTSINSQEGFQHYRTSIANTGTYNSLLASMHSANGAMFNLLSDDTQTVASIKTYINNIGATSVESVEDVNEPNIQNNSNWISQAQTEQGYIWTAVQSYTPAIASLGPSITQESAAVSYGTSQAAHTDLNVMHDYKGWDRPDTFGDGATEGTGGTCPGLTYGALNWSQCWAALPAPGKLVVSTEDGWGDYNTLDTLQNGGDINGLVPQDTKGDYVAEMFLLNWLKGVPRSDYFEWMDGNSSQAFSAHGLHTSAGNIKISGTVMTNLRRLLADNGSTAATFTPVDAYGMTLNDTTTTGYNHGAYTSNIQTHHLILSGSDGTEWVLFWTGCEEFEGDTLKAETCGSPTETLTFATTPSAIKLWSINATRDGTGASSTVTPASSLTLHPQPYVQALQLGTHTVAALATAAPAIPTAPPPQAAPTVPATTAPSNGSGSVGVTQADSAANGGGQNYTVVMGSGTTVGHSLLFFGATGAAAVYPSISTFYEVGTPWFSVFSQTVGTVSSNVWGYTLFNPAVTTSASNFPVTENGGGDASGLMLELSNLDPVNPFPVNVIQHDLSTNVAPFAASTLPRTGSYAFAALYTNCGTSSNPALVSQPAESGWTAEPNSELAFNNVYVYRYGPTTTQNQAVPALNVTMAGSGSCPTTTQLLGVQPPLSGSTVNQGTQITGINDLSPAGNNATAVGSTAPYVGGVNNINGVNSIGITGVNGITFPTNLTTAQQVFMVAKLNPNTNSNTRLMTIAATGGNSSNTTTGGLIIGSGSTAGGGTFYQYRNGGLGLNASYDAIHPQQAALLEEESNGTNGSLFVDGTGQILAGDSAVYPFTATYNAQIAAVGGTLTNGAFVSQSTIGQIGVIQVFNQTLSTNNQQIVEACDEYEYHNQQALNPSNPYASASPSPSTCATILSMAGLIADIDPAQSGQVAAVATPSPSPSPTATATASPTPTATPTSSGAVVYKASAAGNNGGGAAYSPAFPSPGPTASVGDFLLGGSSIPNTTSYTAPLTNGTLIVAGPTNSVALVTSYFFATANLAAKQVNASGGLSAAMIEDYTGVSTTNPIGDDEVTTGTNQNITLPAITPTVAGSGAECYVAINSGTSNSGLTQTPTAPAGWALETPTSNSTGDEVFAFHLISPTANANPIAANVVNFGISAGSAYLAGSVSRCVVLNPVNTVSYSGSESSSNWTGVTSASPVPANYRAFADTSVWNRTLPNPLPTAAASPTAVLKAMASASSYEYFFTPANSSSYITDGELGGYPLYKASTSDPQVSLQCHAYSSGGLSQAYGCTQNDNAITTFTVNAYIPANARPGCMVSACGDKNLAILQPDGTTIDLYGCAPSRNWITGDTVVNGSGICSTLAGAVNANIVSSIGLNGAVTSGDDYEAHTTHFNELYQGGVLAPAGTSTIFHALQFPVSCTAPTFVFPAHNATGTCGASGGNNSSLWNNNGLPAGTQGHLNMTHAQIDSMITSNPTLAYYRPMYYAMADYGFFMIDSADSNTANFNNSGGDFDVPFPLEDASPWIINGTGNPWLPWFAAQSATAGTGADSAPYEFIKPNFWGPIASSLEVVDPCVAAQTCPGPAPTVTLVQYSTYPTADEIAAGTSSGTTTPTLPNAASSADKVIAAVEVQTTNSSPTIATPPGWTLFATHAISGHRLIDLFWRTGFTGTSQAFTVTTTSNAAISYLSGSLREVAGSSANPIDPNSGWGTDVTYSTAGSVNGADLAPSVAQTFAMAFFFNDDGHNSLSNARSGWTQEMASLYYANLASQESQYYSTTISQQIGNPLQTSVTASNGDTASPTLSSYELFLK